MTICIAKFSDKLILGGCVRKCQICVEFNTESWICLHYIPCQYDSYLGFALKHAVTRMDVAGADVTEHLNTLLKKAGINFHTSAEMEVVRDLKEKQ